MTSDWFNSTPISNRYRLEASHDHILELTDSWESSKSSGLAKEAILSSSIMKVQVRFKSQKHNSMTVYTLQADDSGIDFTPKKDTYSSYVDGTSQHPPKTYITDPYGNRIYTSSFSSRVVLPGIDRDEVNFESSFGEYGILPGQFSELSGIASTPFGDIAVADTNNHRIQVYGVDGKFRFQFGTQGKEDGQFLYPNR